MRLVQLRTLLEIGSRMEDFRDTYNRLDLM